jgi:hypothetical protein
MASEYAFSVDLIESAALHIAFLKKIHSSGASLREPSERSTHRYVGAWLPLLAKMHASGALADAALSPPLDVAWLWHCHRLAPAAYARACRELFGVADALDCPKAAFRASTAVDTACDAANAAKSLWEAHFPDEPFFLEPGSAEAAVDHGRPWTASTHHFKGRFCLRCIFLVASGGLCDHDLP